METLEIAASTVQEATDIAAAELGVDPGQLDVTVLEESKGLFGKGSVKIKAEVKSDGKKTKAAAKPAAKPKAEKPAKTAKPAKAETVATAAVETAAPDAEAVATESDAEKVCGILKDLLAESGLNVIVETTEIKGKYVSLSISGRDASYLVGRRGEVLNALQYLMNVVISRQIENHVRVVLDGDNFRDRRQEVLEKLAIDIAGEVKKRGEEAVLDALPAFERRVIHQALQDFEGVVTYSEGEEPDRRVVIAPAEAAEN